MYANLVIITLALSAAARPMQFEKRVDVGKNGQDAIAQNDKFQSLTADSSCEDGENACVNSQFAQCVGGKFVLTPCGGGTICAALPLVNSDGTSVTCTTQQDLDARIAAATGNDNNDQGQNEDQNKNDQNDQNNNNNNGRDDNDNGQDNGQNNNNNDNNGNNDDPSTSRTLDSSVIADGFNSNGQEGTPDPGQVPSLTSSNNFINFCIGQTITNGKQVKEGSCNPAPMGMIPSTANMPTSKFQFPLNFDKVNENESFTVKMAINNLETGHFVNPKTNYFAAPQQLNDQGQIQGHSHIVIEKINDFRAKEPLDPTAFAFFVGLNAAADNGVLSAAVSKGLPAGFYKLSSINSAANHQPVLAPVAQHGSLDDAVYFEVVAAGSNNDNGNQDGNNDDNNDDNDNGDNNDDNNN